MKRLFSRGSICMALILMFASGVLAVDLARVDDVPYIETIEENVLTPVDFADTDSEYDEIAGSTLMIHAGDGIKQFEGDVSLREGDSFLIEATIENHSSAVTILYIDLNAPDFDDASNQIDLYLAPGTTEIRRELPFYRGEHPDNCSLRFFTVYNADLEVYDVKIDRVIEKRDAIWYIPLMVYAMWIVFAVSAVYLLIYLAVFLRGKSAVQSHSRRKGASERIKELLLYISVMAVVTTTLLIIFRNADISRPMSYAGGDEMGVFYYAKNIRDNGVTLVNDMVGGIAGGDMFDYTYSDKLSFLTVKLISLFVENPYTIVALFYFSNYYVIAIVTAFVCRHLKLSRAVSAMVALLYAFSPYIQMRFNHMWLVPYYMLPPACLVGIGIMQGKLFKRGHAGKNKRVFWNSVLIAFLCAQTGMYYAYFACAIFAVSLLVRLLNLKGRRFARELWPIAYILATIAGVAVNIAPNLLYWHINGGNPASEIASRLGGDAEVYGLKLVQMLLPRPGHRIAALRGLTADYISVYPLVNENVMAALGVIAGIGFVLSVLFLLNGNNQYRSVACLNIVMLLVATIGGVGSLISSLVSIPMRSYNRMSIVIMFLSLLTIGMLLDALGRHVNKPLEVVICLAAIAVGIFDQTSDYTPPNYTGYEATRGFLDQVEASLEPGDMVFMLPYDNWPSPSIPGSYKQYIGYLETDDIHWSYGAMQGRQEALWQQAVANSDVQSMIDKLLYAGYDGIYLDNGLYTVKYGAKQAAAEVDDITSASGHQPMVSEDGSLYFWSIENNKE